jgi:prepilin-type processing-associated H-X9-DG protein
MITRGGTHANVDSAYTRLVITDGVHANNLKVILPGFLCPSSALQKKDNDGYGATHYVGNAGTTTHRTVDWGCAAWKAKDQTGMLLFDNDNVETVTIGMGDCRDGTSNTFIVGEVGQSQNVYGGKNGNGNFPIWPGGNNNEGCNGKFMGSHLRVADATYYINRPATTLNAAANSGDFHESDLCFGSMHTGGAQFAFVDGSVHFLQQTINTDTYYRLANRQDGLPVSLAQ